jgi:SPP1 gp7 family putative phage head morphogenesis protein
MALRARRAGVQGLLKEITNEIARLPASAIRDVVPVLRAAEQELTADLKSWLSKADGAKRFTAQQYRSSLVQIRHALDAYEDLYPAMLHGLKQAGEASGKLATKHIRQELVEFSLKFEGTIRPIPLLTASTIARGEKLLIPRFKSSAKRYQGQVLQDIKRQLSIGVVRGETFFQLTNRLARLGGPKGVIALRGVSDEPGARSEIISEGLFTRYRHWAARLARTETLNAYNVHAVEALHEVSKHDSEIMSRWDASLDARICIICRELDHVVVKVGQNFPGGIDHPPAHPNCRCAVVAWRKDWDEAGSVRHIEEEDNG